MACVCVEGRGGGAKVGQINRRMEGENAVVRYQECFTFITSNLSVSSSISSSLEEMSVSIYRHICCITSHDHHPITPTTRSPPHYHPHHKVTTPLSPPPQGHHPTITPPQGHHPTITPTTRSPPHYHPTTRSPPHYHPHHKVTTPLSPHHKVTTPPPPQGHHSTITPTTRSPPHYHTHHKVTIPLHITRSLLHYVHMHITRSPSLTIDQLGGKPRSAERKIADTSTKERERATRPQITYHLSPCVWNGSAHPWYQS